MALKFGTDGIRGVANAELSPEIVLALGRAAARVLGGYTFLVARDTRASGPLLQAALSAGLASEGVDVVDLGVLPTPALAAVSAERGVPAAMISASHNPFHDNGVKLFAAGGVKLDDPTEERLEEDLRSLLAGGAARDDKTGAAVGRLRRDEEAAEWYSQRVERTVDVRFDDLAVVVDCANGAAVTTAPAVLRRLGARLHVIGDNPDGLNINDGVGATSPERLAAAVVEAGAHVGLAFDGDADRVIAVDHTGSVVDGDQVIAICALDLRERGALRDDTVVVTVMTNLGFRLAMAERGIRVHETAVGDRHVLEALEAGRWSLGGEQSGHIIFRDLATTGDGLLTGLQLLSVLVRTGRPLRDLAADSMTRLPQVLRNVRVRDRDALEGAEDVWREVRSVEERLRGQGRVLLRPSGTEPVVRVMVEAPTTDDADAAADALVAVVERTLGATGP